MKTDITDIDRLFSEYPSLASIGTKEQYLEYIKLLESRRILGSKSNIEGFREFLSKKEKQVVTIDINKKEVTERVEKDFLSKANALAESLGLEIRHVYTNLGGFEFNEGQIAGEVVKELSYTFEFNTTDKEAVDMFSCILGDLGYEQQEAVISANYIGDVKEADALELKFGVRGIELDNVLEILDELGIKDFTINESKSELIILEFGENSAEDIDVKNIKLKYDDLLEKLYGKERKGRKFKSNFIQSRYLDRETRKEIYRERLQNREREQNRFFPIYTQIQEALNSLEGKVGNSLGGLEVTPDTPKGIPSMQGVPPIPRQGMQPEEPITTTNIDTSQFQIGKLETVGVGVIPSIDLAFPTSELKTRRVAWIARMFSEEIDELVENHEEMRRQDPNLMELTRHQIIEKVGVNNIVEKLRETIKLYADDQETVIEEILEAYGYDPEQFNSFEDIENEKDREEAKIVFKYRVGQFRTIYEYFDALLTEALPEITEYESLKLDENTLEFDDEGTVKDGWQFSFRNVSSSDTLSSEIKRVLRNIQLSDSNGEGLYDDLNQKYYMNANQGYSILMSQLNKMTKSSQMVPFLKELAREYPWVQEVINKVNSNEVFKVKMYNNFRKDETKYWVQRKVENKDGTFKYITKQVNESEVIENQLDRWKNIINNGIYLNDDAIYQEGTGLVTREQREKIEKAQTLLKEVYSQFHNLDIEYTNKFTIKKSKLLEDSAKFKEVLKEYEKPLKDMQYILASIGVQVDLSTLTNKLIKTIEDDVDAISVRDSDIKSILSNLNVLFSELLEGKGIKIKELEDGTKVQQPLMADFVGVFRSLAEALNVIDEDVIEDNAYELGKNYYGRVQPAYSHKMIKRLKGVDLLGTSERVSEQYLDYLKKEFKEYQWFINEETGKFYNGWLKQLEESQEARDILNHQVLLHYNGVEYKDWDFNMYMGAILNNYYSDPNGRTAYYYFPIFSDSPSAEFVRFYKETDSNYKEVLLEKLFDVVVQEYKRIQLVKARRKKIEKGEIQEIKNFDKNGDKFVFIPELNDYEVKIGTDNAGNPIMKPILDVLEDIHGKIKEKEIDNLSGLDVKEPIKNALRDIINSSFEEFMSESEKNGLFNKVGEEGHLRYIHLSQDITGKYASEEIQDEQVRENLENFFWNNYFAQSQIIQLFTTDIAFYKNLEDFQKRFKQTHSPASRLDTEATWNGQRVGKEIERVIYIKDEYIESTAFNGIEAALEGRGIDKHTKDYILSQFRNVNVSDAQAFRSLKSYRDVMIMAGDWSPEKETAYNNLRNGKWTAADFHIMWQPIKPFVYTQIPVASGIGNSRIKMPVQHKNSEFLLLALYAEMTQDTGKSNKLAALAEFMDKYDIDLVQFDSAVKVGERAVVDLNSITPEMSQEDALKIIEEQTQSSSGVFERDVVEKINYEDYGIQVATPPHFQDVNSLYGSQIRRLITADLPATITVDGKEYSKAEFLKLYHNLIIANVIDSYNEVEAIFNDKEKLEAALREAARGNKRYSPEFMRAITRNEDGEFTLPLHDPILAYDVQMLLNSIIKNRVTKQKIKGGSLIQVSNFGYTDDLNMVFKNKNGVLLTKKEFLKNNKNATAEDYKEYINKAKEEGGFAVAYLECYLPAYSKEAFLPFLKDSENGDFIHADSIPEELRRLVGYRIPTEDKYSMAPLRIKGFLPQQTGGAIMLPSDITTLSGSDFDVDKMYIMLPEFKSVYNYSRETIKKAWEDFYRTNPELRNKIRLEQKNEFQKALDDEFEKYKDEHGEELELTEDDIYAKFEDFAKSKPKHAWLAETTPLFNEFLKKNRSTYTKEFIEVKKIKYNRDKSPFEHKGRYARAARNNMLIDMTFSVLTSPEVSLNFLNPGNFDMNKKAARFSDIMNAITPEDLTKEIGEIDLREAYSVLNGMPLSQLENIARKFKGNLEPLSVATQVKSHNQIMCYLQVIGKYSMNLTNHVLFTNTNAKIKTPIFYNNKRLEALNLERNTDNVPISRVLAEHFKSAAENSKDPTLYSNNQNEFTADVTMLMARLGFNTIEISILLNQEAIRRIAKNYLQNKSIYSQVDVLFQDEMNYWETLFVNKYDNEELCMPEKIVASKLFELSIIHNSEKSYSREYVGHQLSVLCLFKKIYEISEDLACCVRGQRSDFQNAGIGYTIGETVNRMFEVQEVGARLYSKKKDFSILGIDSLIHRESSFYEKQYKSHISTAFIEDLSTNRSDYAYPLLNAFYIFGIEKPTQLICGLIPQLSSGLRVVEKYKKLNGIRRLGAKAINDLIHEWVVFKMSQLDFFGGIDIEKSSQQAYYYIYNFPSDFVDFREKMKEKYPEIAELSLLKKIQMIPPQNTNEKIPKLVFENVGRLNKTERINLTSNWVELLIHRDEEVQQMAFDLFRYNVYRGGFKFNPDTFIHLAPLAIRYVIPGYIKALHLMASETVTDDEIDLFFSSYNRYSKYIVVKVL